MKIILAGGTGFIGRILLEELLSAGDEVTLLVRGENTGLPGAVRTIRWNGRDGGEWEKGLDGADAVVNLAGESVGGGRWTPARKELLKRSRIEPTRAIINAMRRVRRSPSILINASAVGFYGNVPEGDVTEESPCGSGFLPALSAEWEAAAMEAESTGARVALLRSGIVLHPRGGALARMLLPFRFFAGGPLGNGRQWLPWVHADDMGGIVRFLLRENVSGPVNCVAPEPVRMKEFAEMLGMVLRRPSWFPVPPILLRAILGEMASIVIEGQRAMPAKLLRNRYPFRHPGLLSALRNLFPSR